MRLFIKIYALMLILLTVSLSFTEYMIVSTSFDSSVQSQIDSNLKQHQLVKFAIQSGIVSMNRQNEVDAMSVQPVIDQTADSMGVLLSVYGTEGLIYTNFDFPYTQEVAQADSISYSIINSGNVYYLVMSSNFTQNAFDMNLITAEDITSVYLTASSMQDSCKKIFLIAFVAGAIFSAVFSMIIAIPIRQLTRVGKSFTDGDYSSRATIFPRDEVGDLAHTFNEMADSIEDKIDKLELAVKQREDFTAAFAHELKTPMTSIIGYADTLYQKNLPINEAREAAGLILNEGMRLEALSFKLMQLINMDNSDFLFEEISVVDFMKDVENSVTPLSARKGIPVEFHVEDGYIKIEMDLFKTMILNLIDNAFKSGGQNVAVLGWVEDNSYKIAIVDNGRGIPADELARVTEAFYMVDKARSRKEHGAGLGLSLCEKVAEIHGTNLDIWSQVGQGTAVRIKMEIVDSGEDISDEV